MELQFCCLPAGSLSHPFLLPVPEFLPASKGLCACGCFCDLVPSHSCVRSLLANRGARTWPFWAPSASTLEAGAGRTSS